MSRLNPLIVALLGVSLSSATLLAAERSAAPAKPNILFIFTDDQRADTIAALGNSHIRTPNIDKLAARSFVFRNAHCLGGNVAAVCIPARNTVMSGRSFFRYGPGNSEGLGTPHAQEELPTLPKSMRAAGYETYYSEKSGRGNLPKIQKHFDYVQNVDAESALHSGRSAREVVDDLISFLRSERDSNKPFFAYLGTPGPHDPRYSTREFYELYRNEAMRLPVDFLPVHPFDNGAMTIRDEALENWPRTPAAIRRHLHDYYGSISSMDHDFGRLFAALDELQLSKNTIVVFSSDQGIALGSQGLMGKQNLYESSMKVPFLIAGPGIPQGVSDALVDLTDIFPTIADLGGASIPDGLDGHSLLAVMCGEKSRVRDAALLAYRDVQRSVCDGRWKLIRYPKVNHTQLFDLQADPGEIKNLASVPEYSNELQRMLRLLEQEQKRYGDRLPLIVASPTSPTFAIPSNQKPPAKGGLADENQPPAKRTRS